MRFLKRKLMKRAIIERRNPKMEKLKRGSEKGQVWTGRIKDKSENENLKKDRVRTGIFEKRTIVNRVI